MLRREGDPATRTRPGSADSIQKAGSPHGDSGFRRHSSRNRGVGCACASVVGKVVGVGLVAARPAASRRCRVFRAGNRHAAGQPFRPDPRGRARPCRRHGRGVASEDRDRRGRAAGARAGRRRDGARQRLAGGEPSLLRGESVRTAGFSNVRAHRALADGSSVPADPHPARAVRLAARVRRHVGGLSAADGHHGVRSGQPFAARAPRRRGVGIRRPRPF